MRWLRKLAEWKVRVAEANSAPVLRRLTLVAYAIMFPVIFVFTLLATPIVGSFAVLWGAHALGCNIGEDSIHRCHFLIWEVGDLVGAYGIGLFLAGAINPFLAIVALAFFLQSAPGIAWLMLVAAVLSLRALVRTRLTRRS